MKSHFILLGLAVLSLTGCAFEKQMAAMEYRVAALERQNQQLNTQNNELREQLQVRNQSTEKDLRSQYAATSADMEALQEEIRLLNGSIEELQHNIARVTDEGQAASRRVEELSLSTAKMDQRLGRVEQYLDLERAAKQKAQTQGQATVQAPAGLDSEQKLYDSAKQALDNKELDKARQGFQKLLETYPKSENADNAQYWIAESYYLEKWYEKAILEYQTVIEKYPKGNKVPAAMLKQAMAFLQLGDKSNARLILKELEKRYPQSNEAKIATQKLKEF